LGMGH